MKRHLTLIAIIFFLSGQIFSQTWNYVNSTGVDATIILYGQSFPPGQNEVGYACGMRTTYNGIGVITKTIDGGDNWIQIFPAEGDEINGLESIWFINDSVGFAGGWNNYFIKTEDAGETWTEVSCGTGVWYYKDVVFWDENNGVAAGHMNPELQQSVFITSDGGDTWVTATSGVAMSNILDLSYANETTVYAAATNGKLYKSVDRGHNWTIAFYVAGELFLGIGCADNHFMVAGAEEKIYATNDGWDTWTTHVTGWENFYGTLAKKDGTAYISGTDESVYKTTDFGVSWDRVHTGVGTSTIYNIRETPDGDIFASGSQGVIMALIVPKIITDAVDICEGSSINFSSESVGATSWSWSFEGGTPSTSTDENPTVMYDNVGVYDVELEVSDGENNTVISEPDMITVVVLPSQADTPIGDESLCNEDYTNYTTNEVTQANHYEWEVLPVSAGTFEGNGNTVGFTSSDTWTGSYTVKVRAINACGEGDWSTALDCNLYSIPNEYTLSEGGTYCEGSNGIELTLDMSEVDVNYYLYFESTEVAGPIEGTGDELSFGYFTDAGVYTSEGTNGNCSSSMNGIAIIEMNNLPATAGMPIGSEEICSQETSEYTIEEVEYATSYNWSIMPVAAGTISGNGTEVTVVWATAFEGEAEIGAYGNNDCGDGSSEGSLMVMVYSEPMPIIEGSDLVCQNTDAEYSVTYSEYSIYEWSVDGGNIITGEGTNEITVYWTADQGSTTYVDVIESKGDNCEGTAETFEVTIDQCVGMEEIPEVDVKVFPNPANSILNISLNNISSSKIELTMFNAGGKTALIEERNNIDSESTTKLDISNLPQGLYFLTIKSNGIIIGSQKVVVTK